MIFKSNVRDVAVIAQHTEQVTVPVIRGEVISTTHWNGGAVAVTTTYGLYAVYRGPDSTEVQLLAVFQPGA